MPLALLTRPLHACVLVLAALLAVTAYAGPAQDFAAADNGGRAHLLEHWAATPDAGRLAFLEALRHNRIALDSRQQPFLLGADQRFQAAEGDALPDGEPKPLRLNNRLRGLLNTALASHQLVANEVPLRLAAAQQLQKTAKAAQRLAARSAPADRERRWREGSPRPGPGQPATRRSRPGATPFRRAPARRVRRSAGANPPGEPARPGGGTGGRRAHRRRHQPGPGQAPAAGRRPARPGLQRPVAGLDPAARGARPGDHLRPARGDQHGPRRNAHARRLLHLRGATAVPAPGAGMAGALPVAGATGGVLRQRRHRHGPGAHGDPPSLR